MSIHAIQSNREIHRAKVIRPRWRLAPHATLVNVRADHLNTVAFAARFIVLQAIGSSAVLGLWLEGLAQKPFQGDNAFLCWIIVGLALLGLACAFLRRWRDVQWLATNVVRLGLLGTVVGLIIAFSAATAGGAATDPAAVKQMIAAVVSGMYVSLYATLLGITTNLWLKINLRLLGNIDG
jgi:hypothetical protein